MTDHAALAPVSMLRLFLKMGGWFVVGVGVAFLVITLIGQLFFSAAKRFETEGRQTRAGVVEKYHTEHRDSDGDRSVTYWLTLEYVTQAGEEITHTGSVSSGEYRRVKEGDQIDLWYLESAPEKIEITRGSNAGSARVMQVVALILGAVWLGLVWLVGRWVVEAVRARRYGACEEAEVTGVHRTAVRINNRPRYRLTWRDGQGRPGQSLLRRGEELEEMRPGDRIRIYQGLKRAWWAGDVGDRADPAG